MTIDDLIQTFNPQTMISKIKEIITALNQIDTKLNQVQTDYATKNEVQTDYATKTEVNSLDIVIESDHDENGWYRKYRSGWIEQGGNWGECRTDTVCNLNIAFADTNYQVFLGINGYFGGTGNDDLMIAAKDRTTTQVTIRTYWSGGQNCTVDWYACGWGA